MSTARTIALETLERIHKDGAYSHIALSTALDRSDLDRRDRGLVTELVYGTLARQRTLDAVLKKFVSRKLDDVEVPILITLRLAAYQVIFLDRIPDHAVVHESVEMVKERRGRGAAGFTNGVLRALLRKERYWKIWEEVDPAKNQVRHLGLRHSLPDWMACRLIKRVGFERAMDHGESFNLRPPLYFRAVDALPDPLPGGLIEVEEVPGCLRCDDGMNDEIDSAVQNSTLIVQDLGSQLIGHYCAPGDHKKILDPCAGLGGKTLHLAKLSPEAQVVASDPMQSKLDRLEQTLSESPMAERIEIRSSKIWKLPASYSDFDLILVDAPCTGLGVIRRHPETRWRRSVADIKKLAKKQSKILNEAAMRVKKGGTLVYSVCTFTPEEGPEQIEDFLKKHSNFERLGPPESSDIDWSRYTDDNGDLSLNPADHDADAFYAARLKKT